MNDDDAEQFKRWLLAAAEALQVRLDEDQVDRMRRHLQMVLQANEQFNLTRITDPAEAAVKLVGDSLAALGWAERQGLGEGIRVLDIGTGAGYPAVPVAVCRPDWCLWAIDSTSKKARFVAEVAAELQLPNLLVEQVRARQWHGKVEPFDLILTRAVGALAVCIREAARLLADAGYLVCYRGPREPQDEQAAAARMLKRYGLAELGDQQYQLPGPGGTCGRRLVVFARSGSKGLPK